MPKPKPKNKKPTRSEGAIEATVNVRMNSEGGQVDFECGECQEFLATEDFDFKNGTATIEAGEEVTCDPEKKGCGNVNFNEGFTITKI